MMSRKRRNKIIKAALWVVALITISGIAASYLDLSDLKLMEFEFVITIIGVFLGFGLTIFTFTVQLLQPIIQELEDKIEDVARQDKIIKLIKSGISELKQDLWLLFMALISVLIVGFIWSNFEIKFYIGEVCICKLREAIYVAVYLLSLKSMLDLMKSLFTIGDITVEILEKRKKKE